MYTSNKNTTTIKFPSERLSNNHKDEQTKALCVLLGGFNQYGRGIKEEDMAKYEELKQEFENTLYKLSKII